ncbi:MFS transporter [Gemmobacter lutimaris]|uniref:MFS transporter n=1 Tax=Gemmobacter lutimaris TaxID=2306023 RepID=A0A398BNT9_9RHOB|nr:MFS transporter [Gemmobacter lutimaris]RID91177.1 MFS transporter [Gemmobacter lutimaris]
MQPSANTPATRRATRLSFFVAGFVMSCWAPLVPYAKANTGASEAELGLLLLCLGVGSLIAMPLTGWISTRAGARPMILLGGIGLVLILPALAVVTDPLFLGAALLVCGGALGTIDVAMNVHAVEVERASPRPLMSGFHAMFSVGGVVGAGGMTFLLSLGLAPGHSALWCSGLALVALILATPGLLPAPAGEPAAFALPRGLVLILAGLAAVTFLVEGAILDWGALLIIDRSLATAELGGLGYMLFSVAMVLGRFSGDRVVAALGARRVLVWGGALAIAGLAVVLVLPVAPLAMAGFVLIGLGASNLVPVLFSLAGRQTAMPAGLAIAAVTTTGYAGILAGPAAIGALSQATSLSVAFWLLAGLVALVPLSARTITHQA